MTRTGMIKEISALYVFVDEQGKETKVRFTWNDNINRFKPGDIIDFELEERESKEDPEIKYNWFKSINPAAAPTPEEAFPPQTIERKSALPGVIVEEPVKPVEKIPTQIVTTTSEIPVKDILIVRQTCLERATETVLEVWDGNYEGVESMTKKITDTAAIFEKWVLRTG